MYRHGWSVLVLIVTIVTIAMAAALPQQKSRRPVPIFRKLAGLELPNNATSIRENIVDTFSCEGRIYGYYADMENECQVFHVCLPQQRGSSRWSFICPAETVFNQATFVCTYTESSIPCEESEQYYSLNEEIGKIEEEEEEEESNAGQVSSEYPTPLFRRGKSRRITETPEKLDESPTPTSITPSSRNARISSKDKLRQ